MMAIFLQLCESSQTATWSRQQSKVNDRESLNSIDWLCNRIIPFLGVQCMLNVTELIIVTDITCSLLTLGID
jgi:hypothetical protein